MSSEESFRRKKTRRHKVRGGREGESDERKGFSRGLRNETKRGKGREGDTRVDKPVDT